MNAYFTFTHNSQAEVFKSYSISVVTLDIMNWDS